jgi:hypothetical protein
MTGSESVMLCGLLRSTGSTSGTPGPFIVVSLRPGYSELAGPGGQHTTHGAPHNTKSR